MTITLALPNDIVGKLRLVACVKCKDVATYLEDEVPQFLRNDELSEPETRLLKVFNRPIDLSARRERDNLLQIQGQRELSETEIKRLEKLIDIIELAYAEW